MSMADDLQKRAEDFADLSIKFVAGLPHTLIAPRLGGQYRTHQPLLRQTTAPHVEDGRTRSSPQSSGSSRKKLTNLFSGFSESQMRTSRAPLRPVRC
jgi:hypothetical protein